MSGRPPRPRRTPRPRRRQHPSTSPGGAPPCGTAAAASARPAAPSPTARRSSTTGPGRRQARPRSARRPAPGGDRSRGRRRPVHRRQRLALPGVPGATAPAGGLEVRLGSGGCPLGGHSRDVRAREGGRGRHRSLRAATWLSTHGAAYGLCRIYGNEPWHYELRPEAVDHGCPPVYADPTHDPRMQQ